MKIITFDSYKFIIWEYKYHSKMEKNRCKCDQL